MQQASSGRPSYGSSPSVVARNERAASVPSHRIVQGVVVRSGCRGYDCVVKAGNFNYACSILTTSMSNGFGVMDGRLPVEGTNVMVLTSGGSTGWVIGVIPRSLYNRPDGWKPPFAMRDYPNSDLSPYEDNAAYNVPYQEKERFHRLWSSSNRPLDIVPGESFDLNENHVGTRISMYDVELSGGACYVRLGRLDDEIRMRSTNFTKWTDAEAVSEFNDGGYISVEGRGYSYQNEALGSPGTELAFDGYKAPSDSASMEPRPRTRFWKGFLGNLFSWFAVRPRKTRDGDDVGLISVHASQAGNIMVRSSGGVSLERYDRIPVPHRIREPWDPEGDRESETAHRPIRQFVSDDPHARGLELSSKMAWEQASMYRRFDELKKDFRVQEEGEIQSTQSSGDDDPPGSSELNLSDYKGRRAGVFIGDDGSVIIRDAWGSEIVMLGGNVSINTPGTVALSAHNDVVSLAGRGVVVRGSKSTDVSADDGSVRIHGKKLVAIAGGTDSTDGGVLIESLAKSSDIDASEEAGDNASVKGVVIRSEESSVSVSGKSAYVLGKENVFVTSGPDGDERDGNILVNGGNVLMTAKDVLAATTNGNGLVSAKSAAVLHSKGTGLVSGEVSGIVVNGTKIPVLMDGEVDMSSMTEALETFYKSLQPSSMEDPFTWNGLSEKAVFSFRKSSDAGTSSGTEPWKPNKSMTVYEPYWQVMSETGDPMSTSSPEKLSVEEVHGTKCWPGKDAFEQGRVVVISGSGNLSEGYSASRGSLSDRIEVSEEPYSSLKL